MVVIGDCLQTSEMACVQLPTVIKKKIGKQCIHVSTAIFTNLKSWRGAVVQRLLVKFRGQPHTFILKLR